MLEYLRDHFSLTTLFALTRIWDDKVLDDIFQHMTQSEFARTITVKKIGGNEIALTKAAVNNSMMDAQKYFKTSPRRDQRREESRQKMESAQEKIWHGPHKRGSTKPRNSHKENT